MDNTNTDNNDNNDDNNNDNNDNNIVTNTNNDTGSNLVTNPAKYEFDNIKKAELINKIIDKDNYNFLVKVGEKQFIISIIANVNDENPEPLTEDQLNQLPIITTSGGNKKSYYNKIKKTMKKTMQKMKWGGRKSTKKNKKH